MPNTRRKQSNVRLSDEALKLVSALRQHYGLSQTALFEFVLREQARRAGVTASVEIGTVVPKQSLPDIPTDVDEDEEREADASAFRQTGASIDRLSIEHP